MNLELPASHVLKIGEARRFGNYELNQSRSHVVRRNWFITPETVSGAATKTSPVLRLWSSSRTSRQTSHSLRSITIWFFLRNDSGVRANNNFLVERSRKPAGGPLALTFDHNRLQHDFAGQNLGRQLGPGESIEAYYPTSEEEFDNLRGDLIWRVQLRKGLGPSGHGVTTRSKWRSPRTRFKPRNLITHRRLRQSSEFPRQHHGLPTHGSSCGDHSSGATSVSAGGTGSLLLFDPLV